MNTVIHQIEAIIDLAEKMKNAYFWSPPSGAGMRRSYEKYNSVPLVQWQENGNRYTAEYITKCSCNNIYAKGEYTKNGNKTTLTAIKNSLKRMKGDK